MFDILDELNRKPAPFSRTTDRELLTDAHVSAQRLSRALESAHTPESLDQLARACAWLWGGFMARLDKPRVCVLGCGHGRYSQGLAERGAVVTGVDISAPALAHARAKAKAIGESITYIEADYLDPDLDLGARFKLIMLTDRSISSLGLESRRRLCAVVRRHLQQDGLFLFSFATSAYLATREPSRSYAYEPEGGLWSPEPHCVFHTSFTYPEERLVLDRRLIVERGRTRERFDWTQCFDYLDIYGEFFSIGFVLLEYYNGFANGSRDGALELTAVAMLDPTRPGRPPPAPTTKPPNSAV